MEVPINDILKLMLDTCDKVCEEEYGALSEDHERAAIRYYYYKLRSALCEKYD